MKLSIPLADGTVLVYEGTIEELSQIGEEFVSRFGSDITSLDQARKLGGVTVRVNSGSRRWSEQSLRKLWGLLYGEQAKLVNSCAIVAPLAIRKLPSTWATMRKNYPAYCRPITRNTERRPATAWPDSLIGGLTIKARGNILSTQTPSRFSRRF